MDRKNKKIKRREVKPKQSKFKCTKLKKRSQVSSDSITRKSKEKL